MAGHIAFSFPVSVGWYTSSPKPTSEFGTLGFPALQTGRGRVDQEVFLHSQHPCLIFKVRWAQVAGIALGWPLPWKDHPLLAERELEFSTLEHYQCADANIFCFFFDRFILQFHSCL